MESMAYVAGLAPSVSYLTEYPSAEGIEAFAVEVFSNTQKTERWMTRPRASFNNLSPREYMSGGDDGAMRKVLESLIAINFGIYT